MTSVSDETDYQEVMENFLSSGIGRWKVKENESREKVATLHHQLLSFEIIADIFSSSLQTIWRNFRRMSRENE